ncbi:type II secretion system major pseudopilin GspG [Oligoflexus tunisiensis]|uniref:type II secretion system major pseudopilin GspG n=1 Tax=Oligoflexus tunisiensis TaxID=708132 RepID=UPI00114CF6F2|nr:type II secretion system major pseudopilin GspG [Oligoflexus tunisiensis]
MILKRLKRVLQRPFGPVGESERGMTIIEILIVIALMSTIMAVLVNNMLDKGDDAKRDLAAVSMGSLKNALDMYRLKNSRYPTTDEGLQALLEAPATAKNWGGPYVEPNQINDPWGQPYRYESNGPKNFKIISVGADGSEGTEDDVYYPPEAAPKAGGEPE